MFFEFYAFFGKNKSCIFCPFLSLLKRFYIAKNYFANCDLIYVILAAFF